MNSKDNHKYDDIINLPHHTSPKRPHMSVLDRAAQFSPFAALTGYDAAVQETARLTDQRMELDEYEKAVLDERMQLAKMHLKEQPKVTITYFQPDDRKEGGAYISVTGNINKIDTYERSVMMTDGLRIPMEEIVEMELLSL